METRIKLNSLEDLKKYNYIILNKQQKPIKNNIKKILKEKGLNQSDLSELTGICRQNISEIINDKMIPGVVLASQIAFVLNKPVEEVFELKDEAWIKIAKFNHDITLYIDLYKLEIINNAIRKQQIKEDNLEYLNIVENIAIDEETYQYKLKEFLKPKIKDNGKIDWKDKKELIELFEKTYTERYKKLGEIVKPIVSKN